MTDTASVIDLTGIEATTASRCTGSPARSARRAERSASSMSSTMACDLIPSAFAQSARFFAEPLAKKQALAIEAVGGNRGYSGLMHEALDPSAGADMKEAFNIGLDLAPDDPELSGGRAVPQPQRLARPARISARRCSLFRRLRRARPEHSSRLRARSRPPSRLLRGQARPLDGDAAAAALSRHAGRRATRQIGRRRAYRLRQHHAAGDRRGRRARSEDPRRRMDRRARHAGRLHRAISAIA